jgi:DNA invertase Pin-like site-specific DNA recombinase
MWIQMTEYVSYLRLSRDSKNDKNYGLDAQRRDLDIFLSTLCPDSSGCVEVASFVEVQSGADDDRPELIKAIKLCKETGATLLVSKLDRLSRRVSFIATLLEEKGLNFKVACMPNADKFQLHIYAALAEQEREFISARTKAGLQRAKERGVILGGTREGQERGREVRKQQAEQAAEKLRTLVEPMVQAGMTLRQIGSNLETAGISTTGGSSTWTATAVKRLLERLGLK